MHQCQYQFYILDRTLSHYSVQKCTHEHGLMEIHDLSGFGQERNRYKDIQGNHLFCFPTLIYIVKYIYATYVLMSRCNKIIIIIIWYVCCWCVCVHRISDEMENISILNKFPILLQCSRGLQFTRELQTKVREDCTITEKASRAYLRFRI